MQVMRRIKELIVAACAGSPGEWEVVVTGHSLGGALATLAAAELAQAVDVSRGFKTRKVESWFTSIARVVMQVPSCVSIRHHTSAYVSIRLHTSADVSRRQQT